MKKRLAFFIGFVALFLVLLVWGTGDGAYAVERHGERLDDPVEISSYEELERYMGSARTTYLKLTEDISYDLSGDENGKEYYIYVLGKKVLDLNGHDIEIWDLYNRENNEDMTETMDKTNYSSLFRLGESSNLMVNDYTGESFVHFDGSRINENMDYCTAACRIIFDVRDGGKLTINGGTYKAGDNDKYWFWYEHTGAYDVWTGDDIGRRKGADEIHGYAHHIIAGAAIYATKGEIIINDGEFYGRQNVYSYDYYCAAVSFNAENEGDLKVTINDGYFDGRCSADAVFCTENVDLTIKRGTFDVHRVEKERTLSREQFPRGLECKYGTSYVPASAISFFPVYLNGNKYYSEEYQKKTSTTNKIEVPGEAVLQNLRYTTTVDGVSQDERLALNPNYYDEVYTPGSGMILTVNMEPYFDYIGNEEDMKVFRVHTVSWKIEEYIGLEPTGRVATIAARVNVDKLRLDNITTWDDGTEIEWGAVENTFYHMMPEVVEYVTIGTKTKKVVHEYRSPIVVVADSAVIKDVQIDMNFVPGTPADIKINQEVGQGYKVRYGVDVFHSVTSGKSIDFKEGLLEKGDTIVLKMRLYADEGYNFTKDTNITFGEMDCGELVSSSIKQVQKGLYTMNPGINNNQTYWSRSYLELELKIRVTQNLRGTVSMGDVCSNYITYYDVQTNAKGYERFAFEYRTVGETETHITKWYTGVKYAFNALMDETGSLMGKEVRLCVYGKGYKGKLYSIWRTAIKGPNKQNPIAPKVTITGSAGNYSAEITNFAFDQEYIYRSTYVSPDALTEEDWANPVDNVFPVKDGKVVVYTRMMGSDYFTPGTTIYNVTTYAGSNTQASGMELDQNLLIVEAGDTVTINAMIYPLDQTSTDASYIRWSVNDGDASSVKPVVDGVAIDWPKNGYITGSSLKLEGQKMGTVEILASITLPGNNIQMQKCSVMVSEEGDVLVKNITQPKETVYVLADTDFVLWEYTTEPFQAEWNAYFNVKWKISNTNGNPTHFSIDETGTLHVSEEATPGEEVWVYPDFSSIYIYAYRGEKCPVNARCFTVVSEQRYIALTTNKIRARSGDTYTVGSAVYGMDEDTKVTYTSSDESVATVDEMGIITMVGEGTATITASADGCEAVCEVEAVACFHHYTKEKSDNSQHKLVCEVCGESVEEAHEFASVYTNAEGKVFQACSCGYAEELAVEHHFTDTVVTEPSDVSEGVLLRVCEDCGYCVEEAIAKADPIHAPAEVEADKDENAELDIIYDEKVHWVTECPDLLTPDFDEATVEKQEHTFVDVVLVDENEEEHHKTVCSGCGYEEGAEISYQLVERAEYLQAQNLNQNPQNQHGENPDDFPKTTAAMIVIRVILGVLLVVAIAAMVFILIRMTRSIEKGGKDNE